MPTLRELGQTGPRAPLRVAFIGGGINSAVGRAHFNTLRLDGLYSLVAGSFSRNPGINSESGQFYGVDSDRVYRHYEELIERERTRLDALIVLTPTTSHVAPVVAALDAGIPVICEKALAGTPEDVERIRQAERRNRGFLAVTYNYTGYPALRELRAMIRAGRLGRILHFVAEMPQEGFIRLGSDGQPMRPQNWRLHDGPIPTVYLDLGVHLHQISDYLLGADPERIAAFHRAYGNFAEVVDFVSASVDYRGGIHGDFYFGKSMLGCRNGLKIRVFGSAASAEWEQTRPEELRLGHVDGRIETLDRGGAPMVAGQPRYTRFKAGHPAGYVEAFGNLYVDIYEAWQSFRRDGAWRSDEVFGSGLALDGLTLLEAMTRSASTRMPVGFERRREPSPHEA